MTRILPVWIALAASVLLFYCTRHYVEDDSFINFRYVWNWTHGNGIVWNAGERVEGYTSLLMLVLLRLADALGIPLLLAARMIGIAGYAVTVGALSCALRGTGRTVAMVLVLTSLPLIVWAQAGLETLLFTSLLTLASLHVLRVLDMNAPPRWWLGLLYGFAILARPEGMLFAALGCGWLGISLWQRRGFRDACRLLLPSAVFCAGIVAAQLLWRHTYYGDWLPNTYYAKLSTSFSAAQWQAGLRYGMGFIQHPPFLMLYALAVALLSWRTLRKADGLLLSSILLCTGYIVYSGGDWMPAYRFFAPLVPLLVLLLVRGLAQWQDHARAWVLPWVALAFGLMPLSRAGDGWYPKFPIYLQTIGEHVDREFPKDSLIAINMAGIIPASSPHHRYLDMLGLNDRHIARREVVFTARDTVGHVKGDGAYVLSRKPDYIILGDAISQTAEAQATYLSEREMLGSPEFARHYVRRSVTLPIRHPGIAAREMQFQYYERRQR